MPALAIRNLEFSAIRITLPTVPVFYECQRCTACCRWPGIVRVTDEEITRLSALKEISEREFIQRYTRLAEDRRGLVLTDNTRGECVFLEGEDCAVQSEKPRQCREFPNLWNFPGFEKICKAIPRDVSDEAYRRLTGADSSPISVVDGILPEARVPDNVAQESHFKPIIKPFAAS
ncbi:MAG: YkgJ family cysteine cluster protein [Verrucomicrobia bacterium]|nr:YkgJ family cysteine cluster protein [Verrucomicrobiota bacterium]